jgi:hypothetical protein
MKKAPSGALRRGMALLTLAGLVAGALSVGPATAAKRFLTKKKALKLFYTKGGADQRFLNVGEVSTSYKQETSLILNFVEGDVLTHSVTAPAAGTLLIWANVTFEEDAGTPEDNPVHAMVLLDGTQVGTVQQQNIEEEGFMGSSSIANASAAPVSAGAHTLNLHVESVEGSQTAIEDRSLTTLFIPG